ncbi:MAG: N-acetylmuramoyl-L-alanine amidase [Myxococcota bacterium]
MGYENVGRVWSVQELGRYLRTLEAPAWCDAITFHHTGVPSLEMRPQGLLARHMDATRHYYENELGWSAGPHLFIDDDECWGMCDFRSTGVHARSFNSRAIGIEVLGNYNEESPNTGRGLACWETAFGAGRLLLDWLGLEIHAGTVLFHRDDPKTTKTCPGSNVEKSWVLENLQAYGTR